MKNLKSFIAFTALAISFNAAAQNQNELTASTVKAAYDETVSPFHKNESLNFTYVKELTRCSATIKVDASDQSINISYRVPCNAYSAKVLVKDFNGRILKTFLLNNKGTSSADYFINDLLAGVYNYTYMIDEEKIANGSFEIKD